MRKRSTSARKSGPGPINKLTKEAVTRKLKHPEIAGEFNKLSELYGKKAASELLRSAMRGQSYASTQTIMDATKARAEEVKLLGPRAWGKKEKARLAEAKKARVTFWEDEVKEIYEELNRSQVTDREKLQKKLEFAKERLENAKRNANG